MRSSFIALSAAPQNSMRGRCWVCFPKTVSDRLVSSATSFSYRSAFRTPFECHSRSVACLAKLCKCARIVCGRNSLNRKLICRRQNTHDGIEMFAWIGFVWGWDAANQWPKWDYPIDIDARHDMRNILRVWNNVLWCCCT